MRTNLPTFPRDSYDTSITQTSQRCPRKAQIQYFLNRSASGTNVPIGFGLAYHKFREELEKPFLELCVRGDGDWRELSPGFFHRALDIALDGYEDPPLEHRNSYLTRGRLSLTCEQAYQLWCAEKRKNQFRVQEAEQAFMLELPDGHMYTGRFDQILEWNGKLWIRDFKTTGRMGRNYARQFTPNDQMTGYTWAASQLSGRRVEGVIVEVVYNVTDAAKTSHHTFLSARTPFQIDEWLRDFQLEMSLLDSYVESGYFPKRTTACNDYGGCYFRDCCAMSSDAMREAWLLSHTIESHWDPMNPSEEEGVVD